MQSTTVSIEQVRTGTAVIGSGTDCVISVQDPDQKGSGSFWLRDLSPLQLRQPEFEGTGILRFFVKNRGTYYVSEKKAMNIYKVHLGLAL